MTCTDAPEMLKLRRQFAENENLSPKLVKALMDTIDLIRWNHEGDSPECECWQKARRAAVMRGKGMPRRKDYEQKFQIKASTAAHLSRKEIQQLDQCSDESACRLLLGISR